MLYIGLFSTTSQAVHGMYGFCCMCINPWELLLHGWRVSSVIMSGAGSVKQEGGGVTYVRRPFTMADGP